MNYAVVFAGGVGTRMNSRAKPKQFLEIHGKPIIIHTLEQFESHPAIDAICVVCVKDWLDHMRGLTQKYQISKVRWVVEGGNSALASQYQGLRAIATDRQEPEAGHIVLIHDGVRPLIDQKTISDCISSVKQFGSAITVAPATETIAREDETHNICQTMPRAECILARAPQCFYLQDILKTHELARSEGTYKYVDSATMMLAYGKQVHTVPGPPENIKVTTPADFYICRALLDAKENSQLYGL